MGEWFLLNAHAYPGSAKDQNSTSARAKTRSQQTIEVSFHPSRPPLPSKLFVHCPDLDEEEVAFTVLPHIVCVSEGLILLCIPTPLGPERPTTYMSSVDSSDYFMYRSDTNNSSLTRLPEPYQFFTDDDIGILRRGSDHYTVATLMSTPTPLISTSMPHVYDLHRFHSEDGKWVHSKAKLVEPHNGFPVKIPPNFSRLLWHDTTTVLSIGGEGDTMGWVDLWRGILLCDLRRDDPMPTLRAMPLPPPFELLTRNGGRGVELGCPKSVRSVAFIKTPDNTGCLKLVELDSTNISLPDDVTNEEGLPYVVMPNWTIVTWSNTKMTGSWKDWRRDQRVQSSNIKIDSQLSCRLMQNLPPPNGAGAAGRGLRNLFLSDPTSGIVEDVVYVMVRSGFLHSNACAVVVDMRSKKLLDMVAFDTRRQNGAHAMYCPFTIFEHSSPESTSAGRGAHEV
ncbi:hypothetical protein BS78_06G128600 [Paspalum vaginatum]|nr:hypothetical protein BS78_06G128600 [Paspalum vaginatum]